MIYASPVPLRRQGPITYFLVFQSRLLDIVTAGDGPLPAQGHGGFLWNGRWR